MGPAEPRPTPALSSVSADHFTGSLSSGPGSILDFAPPSPSTIKHHPAFHQEICEIKQGPIYDIGFFCRNLTTYLKLPVAVLSFPGA